MPIKNISFRWTIILVLAVSFVVLLGVILSPSKKITAMKSESLSGYEIDSFFKEVLVFSSEKKQWFPADRSMLLKPGDEVKTGAEAETDIQVPGLLHIRLKDNAHLILPGPKSSGSTEPAYRLKLDKGTLYMALESDAPLRVETEVLDYTLNTKNASLMVEKTNETEVLIGMIRGLAELEQKGKKIQSITSMQKMLIGKENKAPEKISSKDWFKLREVYDLIPKTAASEAAQMDLSKKAGNMFDFVFDHGTFFTPKFGFANREFMLDPETEQVYLETEYDVFPVGSFVGIYMKTRNFRISNFQKIRFEARSSPRDPAHPDSFKIELKSATGTVRAFVPRKFNRTWTVYEYPLIFSKPTDIREIAFVFHHDTVGAYSKGFLQMRNFTLEPAESQKPAESPAPAQTADAVTASAIESFSSLI